MKKIFSCLFLGLLFITLFSCSVFQTEDDSKTVNEVSDSLGNQENGLIQELADNASLINGGDTTMKNYMTDFQSIENIADQKASVTLIYDNALSTGFSWNDSDKCYERTISNIQVNTQYFTGTISSVTLRVWFFESTDASGTAVELISSPKNLKNNPNIKSMKYIRDINAELTNKTNGNIRTYHIASNFTVTEINDDIDGVHMVGTRTAIRSVDGASYDANWDINESFDCYAYREILSGTEYYTTYEGTAHIIAEGEITWESGSKSISREVDITFNRTRYVRITVNGTTVTIDIVTGQQVL